MQLVTPKFQTDNLVSLFEHRIAADGERAGLCVRRDGGFIWLTWNELAADVRRMAAALRKLGVEAGDRVVQVSENRYEWIVSDLAILFAGAVHVPVHASLTGSQIAYQIADCGAKVVLVSGPAQLAKIDEYLASLKDVAHVLCYDSCPDAKVSVESLSTVVEQVSEVEAAEAEKWALESVRPDDLATILYTSGTTGEPKGVMLSHQNLASNAIGTMECFDYRADDLRLAWLPLSHIFARTCDLYAWIASDIRLAVAESRDTVIANCAELQPTLLNGVPYFFDKVQRFLTESGLAETPGSVKQLLGGKMRFCCSGGAPLPDHVARFYESQGLLLVQGYGLSECSPVITVSTDKSKKIGSVGKPLPGVEVRIAPDGEILTRGPHVMPGYWKKPLATAEAIRDGWLYTGDLGMIDGDGFLFITGRKKELIVTTGGKKVAPMHLEELLTADPLIAQAVVVGDGRNYLTALIVPDPKALATELEQQGLATGPPDGLLAKPGVQSLFKQRIDKRLACLSPSEQIRKFTLLERPFTVESGELTLTLKLRRAIIAEHYANAVQAMYS